MRKLFLSSCILLAFSLLGCVNDMKEVEALTSEDDLKQENAKDIETYYYGAEGTLKGIMTSPTLERFMTDSPYLRLSDGLKVKFYDDSLELQSILTSKEGYYYENTDDITVKDSVVLITNDGKMLETEILHWDPKEERFFTDEPVKLTTSSQIIYGKDGLIAPPDISWYQFNNASGNIKVDSTFSLE